MIIWPNSSDAQPVGGKGAALITLSRLGYSPPAFFVILPEAFKDGAPVAALRSDVTLALAELGEGPYKGLFSLALVAAVVMMVMG